MSLRPVDMVTMVPKLTEVGKAQQLREQEGQIASQQFSAQLQAQTAHEQHKVNDAPEATKVENEGRRRRGAKRDAKGGSSGTADGAKPGQAGKGDSESGKGRVNDIVLGGQA
jgi:hypothetical protein